MNRIDMRQKSIPMRMSLFCMGIYIFFNSTSTILNYYMLGLAMVLMIIAVFHMGNKRVIVNSNVYLIYLIILMYSLVSLIFTPENIEAVRFITILVFIFIYFITLAMDSNAYLFALRVMTIFSAIHVFFTILQIISPNKVTEFNAVFLSGQRYYVNVQLLDWGYYSGISGQTHMNAFYISIFICVVFSAILNHANWVIPGRKRKQILYYIALLLGIIALVATQKRGILLANAAAIFFTMLFYMRRKRKAVITFLSISVMLFLIGLFLLEYSTPAQALYMRFTDSDNFMSNRDIMYIQVLESFWESPILGNGVASTYSIYSIGAHNIYLQLLNDYGLLGTILFMMLFFSFLLNNIKVYYKERDFIEGNCRESLLFSIYMQIYFLAYGMVGNPLYDNFIFFTYIIACSIPYSIRRGRMQSVANLAQVSNPKLCLGKSE